MARIPLTDIPGAPNIGQPTLSPNLQHSPGIRPLDVSGAALDPSGLQKTRSLLAGAGEDVRRGTDTVARALSGTQRDTIDPRPFLAPYEGMQHVAEALGQSGQTIQKFADSMALANDANTMAQASIIMSSAFSAHKDDIAQNKFPEQQWVPEWQDKRLPEVQKALAALKPSNRIAGKLQNDYAQWASESSMQFASAATKQHVETIGGNLLNASEAAFDNGQYEEAHTHLNEAVRVGALRQDQADAKWHEMTSKAQTEQAIAAVAQNPSAIIDDLTKAKETGKSELFPWMKPSQQSQFLSAAEGQKRKNQADAEENADASIIAGEFTTPEEVRKFGEDNELPESSILSLEKSLSVVVADTPQAQAKYKAALNDLDSKVESYDPSTDPNGEKYRDLVSSVRTTAAEGDRKYFLDNLSQTRREGLKPNADVQRGLIDFADQLQKQGLINSAGFDDKGQVIKGKEQEAMKSATAQMALKDKVRAMMKENPGITADEARQKFQQIVGSDPGSAAAKAFAPKTQGGWFDWIPGLKPKTSPTKEEIQNMGIQKKGETLQQMQDRNNQASLDPQLIDFVKNAEGYNANAFSDYKQTSIGYGTRAKPGEKTISKPEAEKRLAEELSKHAAIVDAAIAAKGFKLTPGQRNALVSFDFNTGEGNYLIGSSSSADEIARRLPTWNKVTENGKKVVSDGLVNRRAQEMQLWNA